MKKVHFRTFAIGLICAASLSANATEAPKPSESVASSPVQAPNGEEPKQKGFASLQVGMTSQEVTEAMNGAPTKFHTYESGKRWIPFYFGSDSVRLSAVYSGQGCLVFSIGYSFRSHTGKWSDVYGTLREIVQDKTDACYQP